MNLHIGGVEKKEGWHILNIQQGPNVDFIGDLSDLTQFTDASCEQVYASHVLEHIPQAAVVGALQGIHRILVPGGRLYVSVPDWDTLCQLFVSPLATLDMKWHCMRMMLGGQVDEHDYHQMGFNEELMYSFLAQAGFTDAERVESFGMFEDTSNYRPYGFPISLNVIATR